MMLFQWRREHGLVATRQQPEMFTVLIKNRMWVTGGLCGAAAAGIEIKGAPAFRGEEGARGQRKELGEQNERESSFSVAFLLAASNLEGSLLCLPGFGAGEGCAYGQCCVVMPWFTGLGLRAMCVEGALDRQQRSCSH